MKLKVNNKEVTFNAHNLQQLLHQLAIPEKGIAVAVNKKLVRRELWQEQALNDGDDILIIKAVCGG